MRESEGQIGNSGLMLAAHSWDIAGAIQAGWNVAFVARPGQILDALTPELEFVAPDLVDLARQIISAPNWRV